MLRESLIDSWNFFRIHYMALSAIILPIIIPVEIFTGFYQHAITGKDFVLSNQLIPVVIGLLASPLYSVGVVFYIASIIREEPIDTKTAWMLGIRFWSLYLILNLMTGAMIIAGFMMLILPGLVFVIRFSFSEFDLLLNKSKPLDAMKNSWNLTRPHMSEIFGGFVVITLVLFTPYYLVISLFKESNIFYWVINTGLSILYSVLEVFYTIFAFRIYDYVKQDQSKPFDIHVV